MDEGKEIQEGFNAGYILEQYRPQLTKAIIDGVKEGNSPFLEGFKAGSREYAKERGKNKFLGKLKGASTPKLPEKDRGREDKGMDREI